MTPVVTAKPPHTSFFGDSSIMWRMTPRLATATLTATLAFALASATAPEVQGRERPVLLVHDLGRHHRPYGSPITFSAEYNQGQLTTPGSFVLGTFTTNPLPTTATLTYNNTPFTIDLTVGAAGYPYYGAGYYYYGYNPNTYQYQISGVLNGSISGDGTSTMMASITGITGSGNGTVTTPPFPISDLQINVPQGIAAPNGSTYGVTTLTAQVTVAGLPLPAPAPEPSTLAVFGLALAGWAYRRRSRSRV